MNTYPPIPLPTSYIISAFQRSMEKVLEKRSYLLANVNSEDVTTMGRIVCRLIAADIIDYGPNPLGIGSQIAKHMWVRFSPRGLLSYEVIASEFAKTEKLAKGAWKLFTMLVDAGAFVEKGDA